MIFKSSFRDIEIPEHSFMEHMFQNIQLHGDAVAFEDADTGERFTFREILSLIDRFAIALQAYGLQQGDVIALLSANCVQFVIIMLGAAKCGITTTTCNPNYTTHEITLQFKHSDPKLVFTDIAASQKAQNVSHSVKSIQENISIEKVKGMRSFNEFISTNLKRKEFQPVIISKKDTMLLLYSSGTTGLPKGVMCTYYSNMAGALMANATWGYSKNDALYTAVPMFHMYGIMGVLSTLLTGTRNVIAKRYTVTGFLNAVEKYKITRFHAVPPMLIVLNKNSDTYKYDVSSLKTIMSAAATLAEDIAKGVEETLQCQVAQLYGMTEFVPVCVPDYNRKTPILSVGYIPPNTEIKIVNENDGKSLGPHKPGFICCRGPQMMKGYFKNPEATAISIDADNWLVTGDVGYCDESNRVYIIDRSKDIIKYKGFQVSPAEVEAVLLMHPQIADCAVVGVPDEEAGEQPKAFIVKRDETLQESEIHNFLKGLLTSYKQLSGGVTFTDEIPKSPSGKILRKVLKTVSQ